MRTPQELERLAYITNSPDHALHAHVERLEGSTSADMLTELANLIEEIRPREMATPTSELRDALIAFGPKVDTLIHQEIEEHIRIQEYADKYTRELCDRAFSILQSLNKG